VTIFGHPLFMISGRRLPALNNYDLKLGPLKSKEEAVQKIKEFLTAPVFYDEKGMPVAPKFPEGNVPRMRNPPPPKPPKGLVGN
jgi:hypothetical protein